MRCAQAVSKQIVTVWNCGAVEVKCGLPSALSPWAGCLPPLGLDFLISERKGLETFFHYFSNGAFVFQVPLYLLN